MKRTAALLLAFSLAAPAAAQDRKPLLPGRIYNMDQQHSLLSFTARHAGFARVMGTFKDYRAAAYVVESDLAKSSVSVVIEVSSVDTSLPGRDGVLRDEFFNVKEFPRIHFRSQRFEKAGDGFTMAGLLTIRQVTREVRMPVSLVARGVDQFQHQRVTLQSTLKINRRDFGVVYSNEFWDKIASDEIQIDIEISLRKYNALNEIFPWRRAVGKVLLDRAQTIGAGALRQEALRLWNESREQYDFGLGQFYRTGVAFMQQGKFEESAAVFAAALEIHAAASAEDRADLLAALAETYVQAGDRARATARLEEALALDSAHPAARELLRNLKPEPR